VNGLRITQIEDELRRTYGGMMTQEDVRTECGFNSRTSAAKFLSGIRSYEVNGRKRWRIADIAKRLADLEVTP